MQLENVKMQKLPQKMKVNSLTIKASHILEEENSFFFDQNDVEDITMSNLNIDSIYHLGLDGLDTESFRELVNGKIITT